MIFPRKKLILPCHKNGYLQSASDARQWRDRFKRNPLAKVADMFVPKPLRMSPGYPCCCGEGEEEPDPICEKCFINTVPDELEVTFTGIGPGSLYCTTDCSNYNTSWILSKLDSCSWVYSSQPGYCPFEFIDFIVASIQSTYFVVSMCFSSGGASGGCGFGFTWKVDIEPPLDCSDIDLTLAPWTGNSFVCDHYSSSCHVQNVA